jgi:protease-4
LDDAIQLAADLAGIEGEPKVVEPRRRFSIRELLESRLSMLVPKLDFYSGVSFKYLMAF